MLATKPYKPKQYTVNRKLLTTYSAESKNDPTKTLGIRNRFTSALNKRFSDLAKQIRLAVVQQDCFGLTDAPQTFASATHASGLPGHGAFKFLAKDQKVGAFMDWLKEQESKGLLELGRISQVGSSIQEPWTNLYITDSYKRGVIRSRYEMGKAGMAVPPMDATGGIGASMGTPMHVERAGILYTRAFEELKGITATMDSQISRVLAQGMVDGDGPALLARKMVQVVTGAGGDLGIKDTLGRTIPASRRAMTMARTEIIRAHHQGMMQEYRNWAVEGVFVEAEWATATDDRVCPQCAALEGKVYTLKEVENLIPLHPGCRCIALPKVIADKKGKKVQEDWQSDPVAKMYPEAMAKEYMAYKQDAAKFMKGWNKAVIEKDTENAAKLQMNYKKKAQFTEYLKQKGIYDDYLAIGNNWIDSAISDEAIRLKMSVNSARPSLKMTWPEGKNLEWIQRKGAYSQKTYLQIQAINQAYMESLGIRSVKLYRGLADVPSMVRAIEAGKKLHRTKWAIEDPTLSSYTSEIKVAEYFARSKNGVIITDTIPITDIYMHKDLFSMYLQNNREEAEFICFGGLKNILIKQLTIIN